ncbi:thioredoxin domain-containing protein 12 [Halyomorpha halys]|uniref:thioredoxin domain-containing protein 12 n=1 Tax=Halyomorpha halys TaxID=286706 RepID=UPI0006D4D60F|nr:uncharacterized protein LOC106685087 [Halyomorpha halys]
MVFVVLGQNPPDDSKKDKKEPNVNSWVSWSEALKLAKQEKKPICILIQDPECSGCQIFKEEFDASVTAQELSSKFILASIKKTDAPNDLKQDGDYVPRVYFASPDGKILSVSNELGNPKRKFNYPNIRSLLVSMTNVIKLHDKKW